MFAKCVFGWYGHILAVGLKVKTHKLITYNGEGGGQTPMHVLHSILPKLNISGFSLGRAYIFEDDCFARIEYCQLSNAALHKQNKNMLRRFFVTRDNTPLQFTLHLNIKPHEKTAHTFHIFSKIVTDEHLN